MGVSYYLVRTTHVLEACVPSLNMELGLKPELTLPQALAVEPSLSSFHPKPGLKLAPGQDLNRAAECCFVKTIRNFMFFSQTLISQTNEGSFLLSFLLRQQLIIHSWLNCDDWHWGVLAKGWFLYLTRMPGLFKLGKDFKLIPAVPWAHHWSKRPIIQLAMFLFPQIMHLSLFLSIATQLILFFNLKCTATN